MDVENSQSSNLPSRSPFHCWDYSSKTAHRCVVHFDFQDMLVTRGIYIYIRMYDRMIMIVLITRTMTYMFVGTWTLVQLPCLWLPLTKLPSLKIAPSTSIYFTGDITALHSPTSALGQATLLKLVKCWLWTAGRHQRQILNEWNLTSRQEFSIGVSFNGWGSSEIAFRTDNVSCLKKKKQGLLKLLGELYFSWDGCPSAS